MIGTFASWRPSVTCPVRQAIAAVLAPTAERCGWGLVVDRQAADLRAEVGELGRCDQSLF
jgi:hypothetical protein